LVRNPEGIFRRRWEDNSKKFLKKLDLSVWTGFFWLKTGTGDGLL
jgi:hypothetical protein